MPRSICLPGTKARCISQSAVAVARMSGDSPWVRRATPGVHGTVEIAAGKVVGGAGS
jgi:hypothetical protein